ncbi:MAG: hypothetical protein QOC81_1039 [Thermoanaerobaculia bacterium]|jgi:hypothetical protein|nr:hypothetical protein [Thermoanaerobaculia bacterium]
MRRLQLSFPQMLFVVATRAALAGGVALLVSDRLKKESRRKLGWVLAGIGVATTLPAALMVKRSLA